MDGILTIHPQPFHCCRIQALLTRWDCRPIPGMHRPMHPTLALRPRSAQNLLNCHKQILSYHGIMLRSDQQNLLHQPTEGIQAVNVLCIGYQKMSQHSWLCKFPDGSCWKSHSQKGSHQHAIVKVSSNPLASLLQRGNSGMNNINMVSGDRINGKGNHNGLPNDLLNYLSTVALGGVDVTLWSPPSCPFPCIKQCIWLFLLTICSLCQLNFPNHMSI